MANAGMDYVILLTFLLLKVTLHERDSNTECNPYNVLQTWYLFPGLCLIYWRIIILPISTISCTIISPPTSQFVPYFAPCPFFKPPHTLLYNLYYALPLSCSCHIGISPSGVMSHPLTLFEYIEASTWEGYRCTASAESRYIITRPGRSPICWLAFFYRSDIGNIGFYFILARHTDDVLWIIIQLMKCCTAEIDEKTQMVTLLSSHPHPILLILISIRLNQLREAFPRQGPRWIPFTLIIALTAGPDGCNAIPSHNKTF